MIFWYSQSDIQIWPYNQGKNVYVWFIQLYAIFTFIVILIFISNNQNIVFLDRNTDKLVYYGNMLRKLIF